MKVKETYAWYISKNIEIGHKWCEIIVKNKLRCEYHFVSEYLLQHQSMGVFLYGEMILSKNKHLLNVFKNIKEALQDELDDNSKSVINSYGIR